MPSFVQNSILPRSRQNMHAKTPKQQENKKKTARKQAKTKQKARQSRFITQRNV
jgi:uncharacterized membrane protein